MTVKDLKWYVYYHSFNSDALKPFNIFEHGGFIKDVEKYLKKYKDKEEFAEKLKSSLMYYFWSKSEYEVIIAKKDDKIIVSPWVGSRSNPEIDVTDDTNFNWTGFYNKMAKRHIYKDGSIKIDVFDQICYRWDEFVEYVFNSRVRRPRKKKNVETVDDADQISLMLAT